MKNQKHNKIIEIIIWTAWIFGVISFVYFGLKAVSDYW